MCMDRFVYEYRDPMAELKVILLEYTITTFITGLSLRLDSLSKIIDHNNYLKHQLARNIKAQVNAQPKLTKASLYSSGYSESRGASSSSMSISVGNKKEDV